MYEHNKGAPGIPLTDFFRFDEGMCKLLKKKTSTVLDKRELFVKDPQLKYRMVEIEGGLLYDG